MTRARSTSPRSATTGTSRSAPAPSWTGSASATSPSTRRLHTLSGGQVVSLGLAAQLLKRPDVLLLDEPTNNLDLDARRTALRRARGLERLPAAGQPRPRAARPHGPHRRARPRRGPVLRRQLHRVRARPCAPRRRSPRRTSATPSRRSSGRSGRCSRPASGPRAGRATPPATSRTPACRRSSPAR